MAAAALADMTARLAKIEGERAEAIVAASMQAGKILPAQKDFWLKQMKTSPAETEAYLAAASVIVAPGELLSGGDPKPGTDGLTADERSVAASMGITVEAYIAAKKEGI